MGDIRFKHPSNRWLNKAYTLKGSDEEKLDVLRKLFAFDHQTVEAVNLPNRFKLEDPAGQIKQGVTTIQALYAQTTHCLMSCLSILKINFLKLLITVRNNR